MAMDDLTEEEKRALRGSKFAPLPSQPPSSSSRSQPRLAHPGGPLKTNKAAALAKFLDRKLHQHPHGLSSINPQILELAVRNAKSTVLSNWGITAEGVQEGILFRRDHEEDSSQIAAITECGSGTNIRHVETFDDPEGSFDEGQAMNSEPKKQKKNKKKKEQKKKKKNKRQKIVEDPECGVGKKPKKKLKL